MQGQRFTALISFKGQQSKKQFKAWDHVSNSFLKIKLIKVPTRRLESVLVLER